MPYKDPEKQRAYMKKYRTPYMREYYRRKKAKLDESDRIIAEARKAIDSLKENLRQEKIENEILRKNMRFHKDLRGMWEDLAFNIVNLEA